MLSLGVTCDATSHGATTVYPALPPSQAVGRRLNLHMENLFMQITWLKAAVADNVEATLALNARLAAIHLPRESKREMVYKNAIQNGPCAEDIKETASASVLYGTNTRRHQPHVFYVPSLNKPTMPFATVKTGH